MSFDQKASFLLKDHENGGNEKGEPLLWMIVMYGRGFKLTGIWYQGKCLKALKQTPL